jgi:molybdopterin/thiamine biosynthesis adenylyltransferase
MIGSGPAKDVQAEPQPAAASWTYAEAFSRHRGLLRMDEQEQLRKSRVAIVGMGGVGGIHLVTLARLGVGAFHIADPERFEVANFNRQYGATTHGLGRKKAEVMAEEARAINPDVDLRVQTEAIGPANIDAFLEGVDVVLDGIDFFALETRRLVFREARQRGVWVVTAGPIGFSAAWLVFSPAGMGFEEYFDFRSDGDRLDDVIAFLVGLAPRATQRGYLDLAQVEPRSGKGPSTALACHLCSGVAATEVLKILLRRGPVRPAPWYFQFDAYRHLLRQGWLWRGNRHPWQRLKRRLLRRRVLQLGWGQGLVGHVDNVPDQQAR